MDRPETIFYPRLEALRGVAALMVAAFHSWQSPLLDPAGRTRSFLSPASGIAGNRVSGVLRVIGNGYGAVILFFVISGFVLSGSLVRGPQDQRGALRFLLGRLCRIYPAVFSTVAVFAVLFWTRGDSLNDEPITYRVFGLVKNALLLDTSIDGVMWSLQVELIAVPLIGFAYLGCRRWGTAAPIVLFLILALLSFSSTWNRAIDGPNLLGTILAFMPGMTAFFIAPRLLGRCSVGMTKVIFVGAVTGFLASRPLIGLGSHWAVIAEAVSGSILVAALAFGHLGMLGRLFDASILRFVGRISYSFYLLHPLTLLVMWRIPALLTGAIRSGIPMVVVATCLFLVSTLAITPCAFAMYRWVEQPGIFAGRKLIGWMSLDSTELLPDPPKHDESSNRVPPNDC